jgi:hypothetical protein
MPTHVGRALAELGIGSIAAGSPQAKGRAERAWGTAQDRLPLELLCRPQRTRHRQASRLTQTPGLLATR